MSKNYAVLKVNNKKFWSGSVDLVTGEIEEIHTYEEGEKADFNPEYYFSVPVVEKFSDNDQVEIDSLTQDRAKQSHGQQVFYRQILRSENHAEEITP